MEKTIKTRDVVKDVKMFDKKAAMAEGIRDSHAKVKEVAERKDAPDQQHRHGADYAQNKATQAARGGAEATGGAAIRGVRKTADNARQARQAVSQRAARKSVEGAKETAKRSVQSAKNSAKTAKSVKTAGSAAGKAAKNTQQAAKAAKTSAKAAQVAARNAAQATRRAVAATKAAVRAVIAFAKMAIAAVKSLVSAIAAGGWVAVVIILVVCLVGIIVTSAYGIFFSGGDMGDGNPTLREVIVEINQDYQTKIDKIKTDNPHDEVMMSGTRTPWSDVLAVYAVKATTNTDDPLDAVTLDTHRQKMLKDIYWDMNALDYRLEDRDYTEIVAVKQADGTIVEETQTSTRRTLYIVQNAKTAKQMADAYGFDSRQRDTLAEMLSPQYASAWQSVLYGIGAGSGDIVEVATYQIGNLGGQPYWSWYGFSSRVEWCACFVSWCANECGYIQAGTVPKFSYCQTGMGWFKDAGCWQDAGTGYEPKPGDIVFFDWEGDGHVDHVGIVEYVKGGYVHTIEGNNGDAVRRSSYSLSSSVLVGYGLLSP